MKQALNVIIIISMVLGLSAFKCSSTELTSAKLYIQQKNYTKAKEALENEIAKNSQSDEGYYLLGYINGEEEDLSAMMENFNKSLEISKKFKKNINDSKNYQWQNNFNKGVGLFNRATKITDKDSSNMFYDKSIARFKNCIIVQPDSAGAYQNMVYAMMNSDKQDQLEKPLKKIIELNKSLSAYIDLSKVYNNEAVFSKNAFMDSKNIADSVEAMESYNKVISLLEEAQSLYPNDSQVLAQLSNAYVEANKMDVAMETFKKGIEKDPENEVYRYNFGVLLLGADKFSEATEQFNKAIELKENYTSAYYNLGVTYLKWGSILQEKAIEENSEDTSYKEKFKMAVAPLEKYLEENPEEANIWNYLGKVYANLGETEKSKEAFDKADLYK